jgi:subtilisin-like proprotein convertase family protein
VINPGGATQMSVFGTDNVSQGTYTFTLNGTDGTNESNQTLTLNVLVGAPAATTLLTPADMATDQFTALELTWEDQGASDSYEVEVATDPGFSNIVATETELGSTNFQAANLATLTTYYWHVRSTNICGTSDWSETFEFTTAAINCSQSTALTEGVTIGPQGGLVTTSALMIDQVGEIADIKITNFSTNHTWVGDIDMTLIAPSGTTAQVFNRPDCDQQGMLVSFQDDAPQTSAEFETSCNPGGVAIEGGFQPAQAFSIFAGEQATGEWRLEITDNANGDEGDLLGWTLEVCTLLPSEGILTTSQSQVTTCIGNTATVEVTVGEGFNDEVTLSATNLPAGATATFEANPVAPGSTVSVILDNLTVGGTFGVGFDGTDGTATASTTVNLEVVSAPVLSNLLQPLEGALENAEAPIQFTWEAVAGADSYVIEIATDDTFLNIVDSDEVEIPEYTTDLDPGQYYWRVTTFNDCGESITEFFVFTVELINAVVEINGAQVSIWPNPTQGPLQISLTGELNNDLTVSVLSVQGQELRQERFSARTGIQQMDLSDLPAGAYLLRLTSGQAGQMLRIIVQ